MARNPLEARPQPDQVCSDCSLTFQPQLLFHSAPKSDPTSLWHNCSRSLSASYPACTADGDSVKGCPDTRESLEPLHPQPEGEGHWRPLFDLEPLSCLCDSDQIIELNCETFLRLLPKQLPS